MNNDEVIHTGKNKQPPGKARQIDEEPEREPGEALTNPAGGQKLSDEELKLIEEGLMGGPFVSGY